MERHRGYGYCYPSMIIEDDRVLLLYMRYPQYNSLRRFDTMPGNMDVRFASFPLAWFYRKTN